MSVPHVDVLIIGAGPGGLAVATGLARQLYTAVLFDNKVYRNARTDHMHNFPGWDHQSPAAFRAKAREDLLSRYQGFQFQEVGVSKIQKNDHGFFDVTDETGKVWTGRKVVLANGAADVQPDIPGYADCWGYVIYGCLFCHGFEERGLPSSGILALGHAGNPPVALHLSRMARRLTKKVTFYTHGNKDLSAILQKELENDKEGKAGLVTVDDRQITKLERQSADGVGIILTFSDDTTTAEGFLVHQPGSTVSGPFARQLSLELTPTGDIKTTQPFCETSTPGVFAVGDCATQLKAVSQAVAMGALAAGGLAFQLGAELAKIE